MYAGCRLGLRVTVSNITALRNEGMEQVESLLHSKAECGIWIGEQVDKTIRHLWAAQWGLTLKTIHYERQVMQTNAGDKNWSRLHSP